MHFNTKLILTLLATISTTFAATNGPCSGRSGICISSSSCSQSGGTSYTNKCPDDPNDIKCCDNIPCTADGKSGNCVFTSQCDGETYSGKCPGGNDFKCCVGKISEIDTSYNGPCDGGGGACINVDKVKCDTQTVANRCPGSNNVRCCVSGNKPSWYVNQGEHSKVLFSISGSSPVQKSVSCCGCGVASLSMGISVTTNTYVNPEDLFVDAYKAGYYQGDGISHEAINYLGPKHGVKVSWTSDTNTVFNALQSGKGVIYHVGPESKYHFTKNGHYIFLYGAKIQNGIQKVYVFDPNGSNNYVNVLFPLRSADGGIQLAKRGNYPTDFGIVEKA